MNSSGRRARMAHGLPMLPGALLSFLPSAACPACLGAYGAVLSSLGLGVLVNRRVLAPLIGVFLVIGTVALAWTARRHKRYGPLVLSLIGSGGIVAGRLLWDLPLLAYGGTAGVVGASIWNFWLRRSTWAPIVTIGVGGKGGESS